ncbi:hypothetical protein ACRAWD_19805 [Caulobacter segnis]
MKRSDTDVEGPAARARTPAEELEPAAARRLRRDDPGGDGRASDPGQPIRSSTAPRAWSWRVRSRRR